MYIKKNNHLIMFVQDPDNPDRGRKLPSKPDYESMTHPRPTTRNTTGQLCICTVCTIARSKDWELSRAVEPFFSTSTLCDQTPLLQQLVNTVWCVTPTLEKEDPINVTKQPRDQTLRKL